MVNAQYENNRHSERGQWFIECVSHDVTISGNSYAFYGLNTSKDKRPPTKVGGFRSD